MIAVGAVRLEPAPWMRDVAGAQLGHQRRVAVEHFHVAGLRGQLDRGGGSLKESALGSDEPDAELIGFVLP